ncbi:hypothetical protein PILCRDRAFT_830082 [Piloderma croceum F 1598]|uniref:Replication factor A protein 3 n=1 Tax=Piloderma croceum (strain F 1598) TaxID=765440 RepID=A0A0C3EVQ7_PILCF|nr:hypothetical protein PILCRDRAFT_830082 [Piloderma croceum F 1598]
MTEHISTRVNSHRLAAYIGRTVRLVGKTLKIQGDTAIVEASDGGQVEIRLPKDPPLTGTYNEIIGNVIDGSTVKMLMCIDLGSDLDMKLVDDMVELTHDPKFHEKMFT